MHFRPVHHPVECDKGHSLPRVAAADVRMHAGKPDLFDPLPVARPLLPQHWLEALARLVQRQRVAGMRDVLTQILDRGT